MKIRIAKEEDAPLILNFIKGIAEDMDLIYFRGEFFRYIICKKKYDMYE